ncbi:MAG: response regulator [Steroidobacterales bacterium]
MAAKRALVVDDSKSARAFLARVLHRYDLQVDGVESAEQAIEYLTRQRPDVIFMDHLMPGMDGFQAVQAIKNNPRTATIPIMMYTSQEGELYLSQARALGAIGVLPKQIKQADMSKALEQLRLLGDLRPESDIATIRTETLPTDEEPPLDATAERRTAELRVAAQQHAARHANDGDGAGDAVRERDGDGLPPMPPEIRAVIHGMLAEHVIELRRHVARDLNHHADRIVGDVRLLLQDGTAPDRKVRGNGALIAAAAVAVLLAVVVGTQWWRATVDRTALAARLRDSQAQLTDARNQVAQLQSAVLAPALPAEPGVGSAATAPAAASAGGTSPATADRAMTQITETIPFGETPLAGSRVDRVQALLTRLSNQGFRGVVQIRSYPGRFCLLASANETPALPPPDTPYSRCDQIGNPRDENASAGQRESVAFANMVEAARKSAGGAYDIQISAGGADEVATTYPPVTDNLTAAEWNRAAAANNRVEVRWQAAR